jgi:phage terminase large subunit GpA-like protein
MDSIADPLVSEVVVIKSAQVGWTEILNNAVGYYVSQDPAPILIVQPSVEMAEAWSKDRLAPMLRDSPALRGCVDVKSRASANTLLHKQFPGGHLTVSGANSAASLASRPIRIVLFDEVDRYPASAGTEGDPVTLGKKRSTTFWNRKTLLGSTPTLAGKSRIEAAYAASDMRRYWVPCSHCGEFQVLKWAAVRWDGDDPATALMHCIGCGVGWTDAERYAAVRKGEWRAEAPFRGIAGFHINELYSPWVKLAETVSAFMAAKGKPEMLKAWVNTALGETWQEQGEAPEWERLVERREEFPMGVVPEQAVVLTAGVDVQRDRLEVDVWAWGPAMESWLIESKALNGDPSQPDVWDRLTEVIEQGWPSADGAMRIAGVGVDTGGTDTQATYTALRRLRQPQVFPMKGVEGWNRTSPVSGPTWVDVTAGGQKLRRGLKLWTVAVSTFKAEFYRMLWLTRGDGVGYPPGWVHLPTGLDSEAIKQMVAEQLVSVNDRRGYTRQEWRKLRDRNERLDCRNYARAALSVLGADRYGDRFWERWRRANEVVPEQSRTVVPETFQSERPQPTMQMQRPAQQPRSSYLSGRPGYFSPRR